MFDPDIVYDFDTNSKKKMSDGESGILLEKLSTASVNCNKGELVKEIRGTLERLKEELKVFRKNPFLKGYIDHLELIKPVLKVDPAVIEGRKKVRFGG